MLKVLIVDDETVVRRGIVLGMNWARPRAPTPLTASGFQADS